MGYFKIIKRDKERATIYYLDDLEPKTWIEVLGYPGFSVSYAIYFEPYPSFQKNIASISWNSEDTNK
jgi:hypothetical protein